MADNARGIHVSPGIYSKETELSYAAKSLGITTLGVVGETVKGPAFEPVDIANWREFQDVFGGTSVEKFKGSQYPKYELPYIAKSYLSASEQLKVVRVLGLSGYNAGPAWIVTASNGNSNSTKQAVAVIRSRGSYSYYKTGATTDCSCETSKYDTLTYQVGMKAPNDSATSCDKLDYNMKALQIMPYVPLSSTGNECVGYNLEQGESSWYVSQSNKGRFKLVGWTGEHTSDEIDEYTQQEKGEFVGNSASTYFEYAVSLNPNDKEYILNVLGTKAYDGSSPIYVESLYDVALEQGIANGEISLIDSGLSQYQAYHTADYCAHQQVNGIVSIPQNSLTRKKVGVRYLADKNAVDSGIKCTPYDYTLGRPLTVAECLAHSGSPMYAITNVMPDEYKDGGIYSGQQESWSATTIAEQNMYAGQIYTVKQYSTQDGKRNYYYAYYTPSSVKEAYNKNTKLDVVNLYGNLRFGGTNANSGKTATLVYNTADGLYYKYINGSADVHFVELDMNDYKSAYRYASTPWIVSNLKGDMTRVELNKLFRFHTISDGDNSNYEVKVSIENIKPDDGTFDVVVRNVYDADESIQVLERFGKCTMTPGDSNYIAYKIGSYDGTYESQSKYITVEVNETTAAQTSVPAGFLGYPLPLYSGTTIADENTDNSMVVFPDIKYNREFDEDVKNRKQYFGLSSWVGVDIDTFTFKGTKAYIDDPRFLSHGFHLDSRLDVSNGGIDKYTVDGEEGYVFDAVSTNSRTQTLTEAPVIGTEDEMYGSIYEYTNLRKFTVFFYGGFDGWDVYRDQRTNTDKYKMSQYNGYISSKSGEGYSFNKIQNPDILGLNQNGITSDWYAYLAGIRQFANPEATDINVFATPGIDYVNQKLLVEEAIEMIEEERADSIYVVTTPDKPSGAGDGIEEMYTAEEAVYNLEDSDIDSNYTCTYYPWVKYLDSDNSQYIYLPPTKDAVRNFASTDNVSYPWFAPAGISRGTVDCVKAHFITKISDEDTLYEGRINPVKTFASDGPKIWGQKNLQINESQMNRIAARRLLLRLRKLISIACLGLIFSPNDATVKKSFISAVTPILDNMQSNRGLSDYRIEVNDTVESRERRELPVKIYIKMYNALEYIDINFIVTPESVSFDDI